MRNTQVLRYFFPLSQLSILKKSIFVFYYSRRLKKRECYINGSKSACTIVTTEHAISHAQIVTISVEGVV